MSSQNPAKAVTLSHSQIVQPFRLIELNPDVLALLEGPSPPV